MTVSRKSVSTHPAGSVLNCAGQIISMINSGEIEPARRIGESSLAERLKISRATIRSALEHLEIAGLVERRPRAGTYLRTITVTEFCEAMDIRAVLEGLAASQAALRAGKAELQSLAKQAAAVDALNRRLQDGDIKVIPDLTSRDREFHFQLAILSGNNRLVDTLQQQRLIEFTFTVGSLPAAYRPLRDRPIPSHREVVKAIESHDPDLAAQVIKRHILRTKETRIGGGMRDS